MNEEPKNIWKKSWKGPRAFLFWLLIVSVAAFFTSVLIAVITSVRTALFNGHSGLENFVGYILVVMFWFVVAVAVAFIFYGIVRWLFHWRNFKRLLFGCACFATLIALFYAEEDWRGKHAWESFKHEWEAKGEKFDRASVIPSPVPDDQNFALTPIVAGCYSSMLDKNGHEIQPRNTNVVDRLEMNIYRDSDPKNWSTNGNWQKSKLTDLRECQWYYRNPPKSNSGSANTNEFPVALEPKSPADDVLLALSKYDSAIEELRQASKLPYSRFPLEYDKNNPSAILLPHLTALKHCSQVLQLRAIAELQNGQSDEALADIKLMLRLTDSVHTEPFLISHLVRIAVVNIALQPVWEGLADHKWSDEQLAEFDQELSRLDFFADYKLSMRGELVLCQGGILDYLRHHPRQFRNVFGGIPDEHNSIPEIASAIDSCLRPSGWTYQSQLRCARIMLEQCFPVADTNQGVISPTLARRADAAVEADTKHHNPYNLIEKLLLPEFGKVANRFAYGQNAVDMARGACALERYRLAHGEYPKSLDTLAPQFVAKVPHDITNGQPLHYRRTATDRFVLYSVGWNEIDDDGEVGLKENGSVDRDTGDWVWQYPAK